MSIKILIADINSACTSNSCLSACLRAFCKNNGYEITGSTGRRISVVKSLKSKYNFCDAYLR